ncbi:hypothetical protein AB0G15_05835 [Streptosporangium sp. NPDC023825]|uniref:hypothetical protein n=1 Tax=Streptosporangium sp. NPDC023825 TaxID=3154909 RepID=UPI00341FFC9A
MTTHILTSGRNGQTEDVRYFCSFDCMARKILEITGIAVSDAGEHTDREGNTYSWGAWPGGSETNYDVWCVGCGDFLWHGLECACQNTEDDREPLTEAQLAML